MTECSKAICKQAFDRSDTQLCDENRDPNLKQVYHLQEKSDSHTLKAVDLKDYEDTVSTPSQYEKITYNKND